MKRISWSALWVLLLLLQAASARAQDVWIQVASGGIDDAALTRATAMAIHGPHVYVAGRIADDNPRIFRAPLRDDDDWEDVTPDWTISSGAVTDMLVFGGELFVSVDAGQLWWLNVLGDWRQERNVESIVGGSPIYSLASVARADTGRPMLCFAYANLSVRCRFDEFDGREAWRAVFSIDARNARSATLYGDRTVLYLGFGGATRLDRECEVRTADRSLTLAAAAPTRPPLTMLTSLWSTLTTDCFGTHQGFLRAMTTYRGRVHFGVAGGAGGIFRTRGSGFERVVEFGDCIGSGDDEVCFVVANVTALAVAAERLYAGTRDVPGEVSTQNARVWAIEDERTWRPSNESGFGILENEVTQSLASKDAALYAGTVNSLGFEVWRRTPTLAEILRPVIRAILQMRIAMIGLRTTCSRSSFFGCVPAVRPISTRHAAIELAFETAQHPDDDPQLARAALKTITQSAALLQEAEQLAALVDQQPPVKKRRQLAKEVAKLVRLAVMKTHRAAETVKTALLHANGTNTSPGPPNHPRPPHPKRQ
jgi:hypothetical protein